MNDNLSTPWPYFGGKQWYAAEVWEQFGPLTRYIEPFAGRSTRTKSCFRLTAAKAGAFCSLPG